MKAWKGVSKEGKKIAHIFMRSISRMLHSYSFQPRFAPSHPLCPLPTLAMAQCPLLGPLPTLPIQKGEWSRQEHCTGTSPCATDRKKALDFALLFEEAFLSCLVASLFPTKLENFQKMGNANMAGHGQHSDTCLFSDPHNSKDKKQGPVLLLLFLPDAHEGGFQHGGK